MNAKAWQYIGAGVSVPLMGWALSDIAEGNLWIAYVGFPFSMGLGAVCLLGIVLAGRKHARQRDGLVAFIGEGNRLMDQLCTFDAEFPKSEVDDWAIRLGDFISKNLGQAYLVRLNSEPTGTAILTTGTLSEERKNYWAWMNRKQIRLHEFIREVERGQS